MNSKPETRNSKLETRNCYLTRYSLVCEGAAGDAELVKDAKGAEGFEGLFLAGEEAGVAVEQQGGLGGVFPKKFDAKMADAEPLQVGKIFGGGLGFGVEKRVAATDVGDEGMRFAFAPTGGAAGIEEIDLVLFAGAAAVVEVFAVGEGVGEDAVLHVKHGHVLVEDGFEFRGIEAAEEGGELGPVEVVAGDDAREAGVGENFRGEFVGDVEGVVADEGKVRGVVLVVVDGAEAADEEGVGIAVGDLFEEAFFAGLDDAQGGEGDFYIGRAAACDGFGIAADVFEIGVDRAGFEGRVVCEDGVELVESSDEDVEGKAEV